MSPQNSVTGYSTHY